MCFHAPSPSRFRRFFVQQVAREPGLRPDIVCYNSIRSGIVSKQEKQYG